MKKIILVFVSLTFALNASFSQDFKYKRDNRSQDNKEESFNSYHAERVSKASLLRALDVAGIRIFEFPIVPAFSKTYTFEIMLNEYENNELISTKDIAYTYQGKNIYVHFEKDSLSNKETPYIDYIPNVKFYTRDADSTLWLTLDTYGTSMKVPLKKKLKRIDQNYQIRTYSKTNWSLNEEIPLLVYASSWYDDRINYERFCGASDLSNNKEETKELLDSSPHYFLIALKISE